MPPLPPDTGDDVLALIRKAGLADETVIDNFLRQSADVIGHAPDTATQLVQAGILTQFQARLLLQGKYKGFRLGPYKILDQIAKGGLGQVYLAVHVTMRRKAALKVLPSWQANDPVNVERFYREARACAALNHPNIVRAFDVGSEKDTHFLVMEYIDGKNLAQRLDEAGGVLPVGEAVGYIIQAATGLQHAHARKLVHRDIHPGNLVLCKDGVVKILDVGIARFFHLASDAVTEKYQPGMVVGQADYMAPEQAVPGKPLDHRADIYSLGATLYHLVTGRPPFVSQRGANLVLAHQSLPVPRANLIRESVPEELAAIINKMLSKKPDDRLQSAEEVIAALQPFESVTEVAEEEDADAPVAAAPRRNLRDRKWFVPVLLGGAVVLGLVAAVAMNLMKATGK
ncbi:MAG TPA: serine/threonine-protein kinase [Gemmata sp.]|nr:serine/threonine-protein kinase [Gemmata sp.]